MVDQKSIHYSARFNRKLDALCEREDGWCVCVRANELSGVICMMRVPRKAEERLCVSAFSHTDTQNALSESVRLDAAGIFHPGGDASSARA